jgi:hypothetical protein
MERVLCFDYTKSPANVDEKLAGVHRACWESLANPGNWWTGAERVAIAAETRRARACSLCRERREALSPASVQGEHDHLGSLSPAAVDAVHRISTDPGRLSRAWYEQTLASGLSDAQYVELLGVLVAVVSIDNFNRALGVPLEPLPEARAGEPSHYRPEAAALDGAYVPMLPANGATGAEADLWHKNQTANVIRALSLVPDAVRMLKKLSSVHYIPIDEVVNPLFRRHLDRAQIELIAGRVSVLNECFY